jgi:RimJ/RimL family protein N-acetyltransferase
VATLTDGVITLRPPTEDDLDAIYEACQDPEIQRWTGVPTPYLREHATGYLQRIAAEREAGRTQAFLAVGEDGSIVGSFSVMELDRAPAYGEIGYWVAPAARGQGVATRAVALLRDWSVQELGLELVELVIHTENALSQRVAERTGFLDTGERRAAPRQPEAEALDHAVYAWSAV